MYTFHLQTYEVIQPVSGRSIFQEWLDKHNNEPGIHHIAYDCNNVEWDQRIKMFEDRGFELWAVPRHTNARTSADPANVVRNSRSQGGSFMNGNRFAFFETEEKTGTCFETYEFPGDWVDPEPDEWFPGPPEQQKN